MPGISKFALKLKSKGLDMADSRLVNSKSDTVNTDLLVGADYYDEIVSPRHMSKQMYGMWLRRTIYGQYLLQGKIPGSSEAVKNSVNTLHITIHHIANFSDPLILEKDKAIDKDYAKEFNHYDALGIRIRNNNDLSSTCEIPKTKLSSKRKSFNKSIDKPQKCNFQLKILKFFLFNFLICMSATMQVIKDYWYVNESEFYLNVNTQSSNLYNLTGFPLLPPIQRKLIEQETWMSDFDWDTKLPNRAIQKWKTRIPQSKSAIPISIPKKVKLKYSDAGQNQPCFSINSNMRPNTFLHSVPFKLFFDLLYVVKLALMTEYYTHFNCFTYYLHPKIIEKDIIHVISKFDTESFLNYQRFPILMQIKDLLLKLIVIITQVEFGLIGLHHLMSHLPSKFWISKDNLFRECKTFENRQVPRLDQVGTPVRKWLTRVIAFFVENVHLLQKYVITLSEEILPHRNCASTPVLRWLRRVNILLLEKVNFDDINKKSSIFSIQGLQKFYIPGSLIVHTDKFNIQEHCGRALRRVRDYVFIRKHASSHFRGMCLIVLVHMYVNYLYLLKTFAVKILILLKVKDKMITENNLKELRRWKIGKLFDLLNYKADRIKIVKVRNILSCDGFLAAKLLLALEMISKNVKDMVESRERLKSISAAQINVIYNLSRNC